MVQIEYVFILAGLSLPTVYWIVLGWMLYWQLRGGERTVAIQVQWVLATLAMAYVNAVVGLAMIGEGHGGDWWWRWRNQLMDLWPIAAIVLILILALPIIGLGEEARRNDRRRRQGLGEMQRPLAFWMFWIHVWFLLALGVVVIAAGVVGNIS